MKSLISIFGFIFITSAVFAQNTVVINQTGNDHQAQVAQTGKQNEATVDQFGGRNNYIDVISTGDKNKVDVDQNGFDLNGANFGVYGYVHQTGDHNDAKLQQKGDHNDGKIDQINGNNTAVFTQTGTELQKSYYGLVQIRAFGTEGNKATLNQSDTQQSLNVIQTGTGNEITSDQSGRTNQFSAFQTGSHNKAIIIQSGIDNWDGWTSITNNRLTQSGNYNDARIKQLGNSTFLVDQIGMYNKVGLEIYASWAKVLQIGNNNVVGGLLNCIPTDVAILLPGSSLDATQLGSNNKLYVNTAGNLIVKQNNLLSWMVGNTIKYTQTHEGDVELNQLGDRNLIWLTNTSPSLPMDVDVDQIGNGNTVAYYVKGVATTCAKFAGSHLDIDQLGNSNSLHLDSNSAGAMVDVLQKGNSNVASVIQN